MLDETRRAQFEEALTDAVYQSAWRYACRLCTAGGSVPRADAEDLLQESLIHAYQRLHQLRDPASFKGWLLSIMRTRFITRYRRELSRRAADEQLPGLAPPDAAADPLAEAVQEALTRLPAVQQELLSLFYLDGLSLSETGQVLSIAPHAVRQRLHRAREALRRELGLRPGLRTSPHNSGSPEGVIPCE